MNLNYNKIRNIFVLFIVIGIICYILYKNKNYLEFFNNVNKDENGNVKIRGKTIWILWLQGWDNAPWYIHKIKETWIKHNPDWNVELVSEANLRNYVPNIHIPLGASHAAISDIIRLNLLYEHGGVWADATMICMMPLDLWLYDVMQPVGFWMYHGNTSCEGPASWFMVSMKHSEISTKWKEACDKYWLNKNDGTDNYFWMDSLFFNLLSTDEHFMKEWQQVPYVCCEDIGQAHMLAGKCFDNDESLKHIIKENPPFAIKLSRHGAPDSLTNDFKNTNMYYAIECSLNDERKEYILPEIKYNQFNNIINNEKVVVIADCNHDTEMKELKPICDEHDVQMIVYDKCNFGKHVEKDIYCRPLKNVGREQATYLYFVITHYENLPYDIYLLPGNIHKHERINKFKEMLNNNDIMGLCANIKDQWDFTISEYEGKPQKMAEIRPFKTWFEKNINEWNDNDVGPCWYGMMHTNRDRILKHTKDFYINIYNQLIVDNSPEVGHYMERSMAAVY